MELSNLLTLVTKTSDKTAHKIALPTMKETNFVKTEEITRCQSVNNYTIFYLTTAKKITVSKPIYEYEELLKEYGFVRVHQSHLVNIKLIKSWIKEDGGYLLMEDSSRVPVSRQKKELLKLELARGNKLGRTVP